MHTSYFGRRSGFTLAEVMIVMVVLGVIVAIVVSALSPGAARETAYETSATAGLQNIANAAKLYLFKYNTLPGNGNATIPTELQPYVADTNGTWPPPSPWPNSYYDWEAWSINPASSGAIDTYQISIRFCVSGDSAQLCTSHAPNASWATGFNQSGNSYYYCIKGYCRPVAGQSTTIPGYCVNCPNHVGIKYSGEP